VELIEGWTSTGSEVSSGCRPGMAHPLGQFWPVGKVLPQLGQREACDFIHSFCSSGNGVGEGCPMEKSVESIGQAVIDVIDRVCWLCWHMMGEGDLGSGDSFEGVKVMGSCVEAMKRVFKDRLLLLLQRWKILEMERKKSMRGVEERSI